jgi:phosphatidylserine decarboxylase
MNSLYFKKIEYAEHLWHKANTKIAYLLSSSTNTAIKNYLMNWFLRNYEVNFEDLDKKDIKDYKSFNDFFTRPLKKDARVIDQGKTAIVSSVDGTIGEYGNINAGTLVQAKNITYALAALLGSKEKAAYYNNGKFITIYLAPTDYHRIHMPFDGKLINMTYIPGRLFSVQPSVINTTEAVFSRNERAVCHFDGKYGKFSVVLVGAQLVSGLETVWHGKIARQKNIKTWDYSDINLKKGEELGRFNFGSTVILCFDNKTNFNSNLKPEITIKLGTNIASYTVK